MKKIYYGKAVYNNKEISAVLNVLKNHSLNLIEVQKNSYKELTEYKTEVDQNLIKGFDRVFKSIFPIEDLNDKATLEYVSYRLEKPKFDVEECIARGLTYS